MTSRTPIVVALAGICLASTLGYLLVGDWTGDSWVRLIQQVGVIGTVLGVILGAVAFMVNKLSDYQEPASDDDFERVVARSEFLAEQGLAVDPDEDEFLAKDPFDDHDFEALVRDALDDLPDLLQGVLDTNVAVVISDQGRRHGAYGLYMGDGATRDEHSDRIMIFRDTLRRDFGHDPDLLREQVTVTVRHELAHHVGFDELGVRDLGL